MDDSATGRVSVLTSRRAAVTLGAKLAALAALVTAGSRPTPAEAKRKRKPKPKPVRLQAPNMLPSKEVPPDPGDPNGHARAVFTIKNGNIICAKFTILSLSPGSVIEQTHIHQAPVGVNGPVVVDFGGKLNKCVAVPKPLANKIKARPNQFYANIHTNLFDGAVRDQLRKAPKARKSPKPPGGGYAE